jgi:CRISPR-associated protein Csm2
MAPAPYQHRDPPRDPGRGGPPSGQGGGQSLEQRLKDKTAVQYFAADDRRSLRAELLDQEAEAAAKTMRGIPASQLRRFFASVMGLKRRLELEQRDAEFIRAEMAFLKAAAAYAVKRLPRRGDADHDPDWLVNFFARHANAVKDEKDFIAFARHFEAVMAYHKCFEIKQRRD